MIYHYGSDNPYSLYFEPLQPELAGFSSVLVDLQKLQIQTENLPYPHFPAVSSWAALSNYQGKGKDSLFDWVVSQLNHGIKTEKITDLSGFEQKIIGETPYRKLIVIDSNRKRVYVIREKNFQGSVKISDRLGVAAMKYYPEKSEVLFADGLEWIYNSHTGDYFAKYYDDDGRKIRFHKDNFISEEECDLNPYSVYYSIGKMNTRVGWYHAEFVRCRNVFSIYGVNGNICRPDEIKVSGTDESAFKSKGNKKGLSMLFSLHKIFSEGRTLASPECPLSFRDVVARDIPYLVKMFHDTNDDDVRKNFIKILCLVTCPEYPDFYSEAYTLFDDSNNNLLSYELGILLGDGTAKEQQEILRRICALRSKSIAICMFSRALWKNPDLVFNIPQDTLTDYLKAALYAVKSRPLLAFEYVLAVMRLRSLGKEKLNKKLSMHNPVIVKLCKEVEKRIKEVKDNPSFESLYKSRINFDDKTVGLAKEKNIPVFLYALLIYITGEKGENEIKITEIKEEE